MNSRRTCTGVNEQLKSFSTSLPGLYALYTYAQGLFFTDGPVLKSAQSILQASKSILFLKRCIGAHAFNEHGLDLTQDTSKQRLIRSCFRRLNYSWAWLWPSAFASLIDLSFQNTVKFSVCSHVR